MKERINRKNTMVLSLLFTLFCLFAFPAYADVTLPHVFGNSMVLQRDMQIPVWGWADADEKVTVKFNSQTVSTTADKDGKWRLKLDALKAGGPYKMTVTGLNKIQLTDILVGEVWLCSGQSNMEFPLNMVVNSEKEVAAADYPQIRLFRPPHKTAAHPQADVDATWAICKPPIAKSFSATAQFFARKLYKELNVPIGLIESAWGGTRIEPWTPPEGFAQVTELSDISRQIQKADADYKKAVIGQLDVVEQWVADSRKALQKNGKLPEPIAWPKHFLNHRERPTSLYNPMIYPLIPFAIRGAIWYQGESNVTEGMLYYHKMKALIGGWRQLWGQGDFPFYFVQLAPFRYTWAKPYHLPKLWEAQTASLSIPNTGMAVTIGTVDNIEDIHPKNKQDVGYRLALWALAKTYGQKDLVYSGPLYKSMKIEGNKIRISFDHIGGGLASRDGKALDWFEIAAADEKFVEAKAQIDGDTVVVSSDLVAEPKMVRFGWDQEAQPNLINKEGLPASPFRTHRP